MEILHGAGGPPVRVLPGGSEYCQEVVRSCDVYVGLIGLRYGSYAAEVIDGLRVGPQTRASYIKNLRNHIEPYPVAAVPLAHLTGAKLTAHYRVLERSGRKDHKAGAGLSPRTVR